MKALNNLGKTIPNFFNSFVHTGQVEIVQIVEFPSHFVILAYDSVDDDYSVSDVHKGWEDDESNAFTFNETFFHSDAEEDGYFETLEGYAIEQFLTRIGSNIR